MVGTSCDTREILQVRFVLKNLLINVECSNNLTIFKRNKKKHQKMITRKHKKNKHCGKHEEIGDKI